MYGTDLKLKNDLMNFNEIWLHQYSFIGVDYVLYFSIGIIIRQNMASLVIILVCLISTIGFKFVFYKREFISFGSPMLFRGCHG